MLGALQRVAGFYRTRKPEIAAQVLESRKKASTVIAASAGSLDPRLVGRRVELRISQREVIAVAFDTGELACRHVRSFARHRTITALEHARALRELRGVPPEPEVDQRPLDVYDALIPA
jgi:hypothetical protein